MMSEKNTSTSATDGQQRAIIHLTESAAVKGAKLSFGKVETSQEGWQKVIEQGDILSDAVMELVIAKINELAMIKTYADEEVESNYGYLSGYKPEGEDLDRQIGVIQKLLAGVGGANPEYLAKVKDGKVPLPNGAEKFFAIVNWQKFPEQFADYNDAGVKIIGVFKGVHGDKFVNYRDGELGPKYLRQSKKSIAFWKKLSDEQGNPDILIVPAQFGIRHRGRSVRRALAVMGVNEFGLGLFATTIMLLTHPERLAHYDDLFIDIAGDEYSPPYADGAFSYALYFRLGDGRLGLYCSDVDSADGRCGSVSGFAS